MGLTAWGSEDLKILKKNDSANPTCIRSFKMDFQLVSLNRRPKKSLSFIIRSNLKNPDIQLIGIETI